MGSTPDRSLEWGEILNQGMVLLSLQAQRLNEAASSPEGPDRLSQDFLLLEHPFGRFEKWLSETVLVAYLAASNEAIPISIRNTALQIAADLSALVSHRSYRSIWLRLPYTVLTSVGGAQAMLEALGVADSKGSEALHLAIGSGSKQWTSRGAAQAVERSWLRRRAIAIDEDCLAPNWPAEFAHPIYLLRSDVYRLTHDVWFGTDFGRITLDSRSNVEAVFRAIGPWLGLIGDLDCLGEVVASQFMLGLEPDPGLEALYRFNLLRRITAMTPKTQPQQRRRWFARLPRDESVLFRVADYHPAYVGLVAAMVLIGRRSCLRAAVAEVSGPLSDRDLELFSSCVRGFYEALPNPLMPSWPSVRETLSKVSAESAIDGMLISAARRRQLTLMGDLLKVWRAGNRKATWTVSESDAFVTSNAVDA